MIDSFSVEETPTRMIPKYREVNLDYTTPVVRV